MEIVDSAEKIAALIPHLEEMLQGVLVKLEEVGVIIYSPSRKAPGGQHG